ncbi:hypothetical protein WMW72_29190 [Paenibacillus filicis]|uniref:Uncharacterized protein n=1 Tax=Paenibacillus filicis TaxID=669464 RepID=A0ABU9DSY3_9BACL
MSSVESYYFRIEYEIPQWDIAVQGLTLLLGLKYMLKVRLHHALTLTVSGLLAFMIIQGLVLKGLEALGIVSMNIIYENIGIDLFTLQVSCHIVGFGIAYTLYKLRLGFSYVTVPACNRHRSQSPGDKLAVVVHILAVLIVLSTMFLVIQYGGRGLDVVVYTGLPVLAGLMYLAYQEEIRT